MKFKIGARSRTASIIVKFFDSRCARIRVALIMSLALLSATPGWATELDLRRDLLGALEEKLLSKNHEKYLREIKEVPNFPGHAAVVFDFDRVDPTLRFEYDQEALKRPEKLIPEALLFSALCNYGPVPLPGVTPKLNPLLAQALISATGTRTTAFGLAEIWRDARAGDVSARIRYLRWHLDVIDGVEVSDALEREFPGTQKALARRAQALRKQIAKLQPQLPVYREPDLDKVRIKTLVANNDRAGVAALIRSKLTWASLPAVQKKFWREWLEAVEHPSAETVWLFRGFQDQRAFTSATTESAGQTGLVAQRLFPSLQQGDTDRRVLTDSQAEVVPKLTDAMESHSEASAGASIFMSFSLDFNVAAGFVGGTERFPGPAGELLAVRVDKRRAISNFFSGYGREREYLAPLLIFPDEVMRLQKGFVLQRDEGAFLAAIEAQGYKPLSQDEISRQYLSDGRASVSHYMRSSCQDLFHLR